MKPAPTQDQTQSTSILTANAGDIQPSVAAQPTTNIQTSDEISGPVLKLMRATCCIGGLLVGIVLFMIVSNENNDTTTIPPPITAPVAAISEDLRPASPSNTTPVSKPNLAPQARSSNTGNSGSNAVSRLLTKIERTQMGAGESFFLADELATHGKAALPQIAIFREKWANRQFEIEQMVRTKYAFQNVYAFDFPEFHQARDCVEVADRAAGLIHQKKK